MATLTSNAAAAASLAVSGTTQKSTTISWSLPTVPSGATITSCTLTGTATASMSKGSATITVNGTTVSSGSNFTINLGTGNTTSSVTATANGGNKNASGTVTFSNLVYTVNYSINYTVTFVDYDGTVLKTQSVASGSSATAPTVNARYGYEFTGWSVDFSNVTSNITTTAQYSVINIFAVKENGNWTNITKIFRKVDSVWVEQDNASWTNIFDANTKYARKEKPIIPTAILYSDGYMAFLNDEIIDYSHGDIVGIYTGWDTNIYTDSSAVPWSDNRYKIKQVYINGVSALSTQNWFNGNYITDIIFVNFDTSNVTSMSDMFYSCTNLTSLDLSSFDTSNVTSMSYMFYRCTNLTSLDLSNFDTSKVTSMSNMFDGCTSLTSLDLSSFDTSNVTSMRQMFYDCQSLTSIDLSNFDTSKVRNMSNMFYRCTNLTSIDLSSFDTSNVTGTNMSGLFNNCTNLQTIYVKDEATKTKIESYGAVPTTATVIVGSPA